MEQELKFELVDGAIAIVTINRPAARHAVNAAVAQALAEAVKRVEGDGSIRAAVLASTGGPAFCAGADLGEVAQGRTALLITPDGGFGGFTAYPKTKPWIAAVNGAAVGGGCELVLACDMIVAAPEASFGLPEVKRGLIAGAGGVHRLTRVLPRNMALELVATGAALPAAEAHRLGMVNRLVAREEVLAEALSIARAIMANAPLAVAASLDIARLAGEMPDKELQKRSRAALDAALGSEDAQEGPRAFLEKRAPVWVGR